MTLIQTDDLDIDCDDAGPRDAPVVVLLHGRPDDRSSWAEVAQTLNAHGLRMITPSLRGLGAISFRTDAAPRTGNSVMLALDTITLMNALGIERFYGGRPRLGRQRGRGFERRLAGPYRTAGPAGQTAAAHLRHVHGFRITPYDIPAGCTAACFPECNPLLPLAHHAEGSKVLEEKAILVRFKVETESSTQ